MYAWPPVLSSIKYGIVGAFFLIAVTLTAIAQTPRLDVVYIPTPQDVVDRMLEMAEVKKGEYLIDLGSGDGRIPVTAAKKYGARGFGVDINPQRVQEAEANARREGVTDLVEFRVQNLYDTDISKAAVLTMYLLSKINLNLRPRILDTLRPGVRVVSHAFDMGDWTPDRQDSVGYRRVFLWIVPAKIAGTWQVSSGEFSGSLDLDQTFQQIGGEAKLGSNAAPVEDGWLRGTRVSFAVVIDGQRRSFVGTVNGDRIDGIAAESGGVGWVATRSRRG
jgi:hypothetical protein